MIMRHRWVELDR